MAMRATAIITDLGVLDRFKFNVVKTEKADGRRRIFFRKEHPMFDISRTSIVFESIMK